MTQNLICDALENMQILLLLTKIFREDHLDLKHLIGFQWDVIGNGQIQFHFPSRIGKWCDIFRGDFSTDPIWLGAIGEAHP